MYSTWIKYINLFGIRNLNFRVLLGRIGFFVLLPMFLYLWRQPLGDILLLISYICVYERARFNSKSYSDYVHLSSFSISGINKFILMYLSHLLNFKFLFFIVVTVMEIISDYFNIFYIFVMLLALLIISLFTLNIVLMAMRNIKIFHLVKAVFSIIMLLPFFIVDFRATYDIRDLIGNFYQTNTFYIFCALIFVLPLCFILNYQWFRHIVCRRHFPSPEVIGKIRNRKYFSLF